MHCTKFGVDKHANHFVVVGLLSKPARCQPKVMFLVGGLDEIHRENRLIIMLPTSVSRCAASVIMARLCAA